jgi:hypothetical protein
MGGLVGVRVRVRVGGLNSPTETPTPDLCVERALSSLFRSVVGGEGFDAPRVSTFS